MGKMKENWLRQFRHNMRRDNSEAKRIVMEINVKSKKPKEGYEEEVNVLNKN